MGPTLIASILGIIQSVAGALGALFNWLAGERLRRLGEIEVTNKVIERANEDLLKAAEIDRRPVESDPDLLLDGLRPPDQRPR